MTDSFLAFFPTCAFPDVRKQVEREEGKQEGTRSRLTEHFPYLLYLRPRSETVYR